MTNYSKSILDDLRTSVSLADIIGEKVSWDLTKTKASRGDFWAPCPFHDEKTASFHVDSNKGFYYCFGCQAKGDVFTFLKEYERLSFAEAVTYLAERGGIALPKQNDKTNRENKIQLELFHVLKEASNFFEEQLNSTNAITCRQYLEVRGVTDEAREHFEIGFSPNSRNALYRHLKKKNYETGIMVKAGLCMTNEKDSEPFDRFRNRVMFPIKDPKGRIIAFGGRSLDTNASAKYLNSPETPLFSKGKVLYNHSKAKAATKSKTPLLLVEGYMDVVALFKAGFRNVVAPLGTAITENQLQLIWRLDLEPIVLFDGDTAGQNAASKLLALALPSLEPDKSMRFAKLPVNQDPDDFLKSEGREGMNTVIKNSLPAIEVLWTDVTNGGIFDSPERRASLELKLKKNINKIKNYHLRTHFAQSISEIKHKFFLNLKGSKEKIGSGGLSRYGLQGKKIVSDPRNETKNSFLGQQSNNLNVELRLKEGSIVLGCINHPAVAHMLENQLSRLNFTFPDLIQIRDAILAELPLNEGEPVMIFHKKIKNRLKFDAIEKLKKIPQLRIHPYFSTDASKANATKAISEAMNHHSSLINFQTEISLAEAELFDTATEAVTARIDKASKILQQAIIGSEPQALETDEMTKASIKRLDLMIEDKIWLKKK